MNAEWAWAIKHGRDVSEAPDLTMGDVDRILGPTSEQEELEVMLPDVAAAIVDPQLDEMERYVLYVYLMGTTRPFWTMRSDDRDFLHRIALDVIDGGFESDGEYYPVHRVNRCELLDERLDPQVD